MARGYIYTNKKQSVFGIMSTVFGLIGTVTYILCVIKSYNVAGVGVERYGISAFLATVFTVVGFGLGIYLYFEAEKFMLFKIMGIAVNTAALLCLSGILYAGAFVY